jgi:two-component system cell cycle sensor histidine kinase/response regulator CckA
VSERSPPPLLEALRATFDASPVSAAVSTVAGVVYANQACARLFGYPSTEALLGRSPLELIAPGARDLVLEFGRRRALGAGLPPHFLTRGRRADGGEFPLEIGAMVPLDDGHLLVTHRELPPAPRPVAGATPAGGDALYRAVFEVNSAIKLLIDPATGNIIDANQAAVDFYGWPLAEMREMRISDINTLTAEELRAELHAASSGRRGYFRFRHRIASGAVRLVEVHSGPVELGERQLLLSIIHDVTERDALEAHLRTAQRLEAVGRLAGSVAHEFNNLLTVTLTASEAVRRKLEPTSPHRRFLDDIAYASERAAALTRELLAFSRRQHRQPRPLDLSHVVGELGGVLQRTFADEVALALQLAPGLPPASGDPAQLEQVVMNLVMNARHASARGATIEVETGVVDLPTRTLDGVPAGRWLTLRVRDTGHGMDEATRARVFEPLFTTKPAGQGTGLGMATVYGIVMQGGGHITIDSTPGVGTTVTVFLPPAAADGPAADPEPPVDAAPRPGSAVATVLVVDDLAPVRAALTSTLQTLGYDVRAAASVDEALALAGEHGDQVDVVISDVQMPGRSGLELAAALFVRNPALPVLLVSGDLRGLDPSTVPGRPRLLPKPFTLQQLDEAVRALRGHGR